MKPANLFIILLLAHSRLASLLFIYIYASSYNNLDVGEVTLNNTQSYTPSNVPALFVFGDSTVDVGNNNHLWTMARADYYPYGKDFDQHQATGRFTNGRLSVDYLASFLNLPLIPPYLQNTTADFSHGVNFASAGSGILDSTGDVFGEHISLERQVDFFEAVRMQINHSLGPSNTSLTISRSIYFVSTGTNDYLKNYFNVNSNYSRIYSEEEYQTLLLDNLSQVIQRLYNLGARKFIFVDLPPIGSLPSQMAKFKSVNGSHIYSLNLVSKNHNNKLKSMLITLESQVSQATLVYINAYDLLVNFTNFPKTYGFENSKRACCGMGRYAGGFPCLPNSIICRNSSTHVFWDRFHPTSNAYYLLAQAFWDGGLENSSPMNVKQLAIL